MLAAIDLIEEVFSANVAKVGKAEEVGRSVKSSRRRARALRHRSPEAVARLRLPQNVACGFPALRSSKIGSQHCDRLQLPVWEV